MAEGSRDMDNRARAMAGGSRGMAMVDTGCREATGVKEHTPIRESTLA